MTETIRTLSLGGYFGIFWFAALLIPEGRGARSSEAPSVGGPPAAPASAHVGCSQ